MNPLSFVFLAAVSVLGCGGSSSTRDPDAGPGSPPDAAPPKKVISFAGRLEGEGTLRAAAGGRIITPTEFETFRDCGKDGLCPGDPGYVAADEGEGDAEYHREEDFLDCGVDRLCPEDPGYPGPDRGEADGLFQAVFLAGFQGAFGNLYGGRPMQGVHDDIWVRALVLEQGPARVVILELDVVGLMPKYTNAIKRRLRAELGILPEGVVVAALHNHEAPDAMGLWSSQGVDSTFILAAVEKSVDLVRELLERVEPVVVRAAEAEPDACLSPTGAPQAAGMCQDPDYRGAPEGDPSLLVTDLRDPFVRDLIVPGLRLEREDGTAVATMVGFANHVETLADENPLVSADYPGYLRERLAAAGGGEPFFVAGAVGGMMTPLRGTPVPLRAPSGDRTHDAEGKLVLATSPSFDKARSLGYEIADAALGALALATAEDGPRLVVETVDLEVPISSRYRLFFDLTEYLDPEDNRLYDSAECGDGGCLKTDLTLVTLGSVSFLTVPGELLPEIWIGRQAVSVPYPGLPEYPFPELAGIRRKVPGKVRFLVGMANAELGYLIPESDFLAEGNPYLGGVAPDDHPNYYEESVSPGAKVGILYCNAALALLGTDPLDDCHGVPMP